MGGPQHLLSSTSLADPIQDPGCHADRPTGRPSLGSHTAHTLVFDRSTAGQCRVVLGDRNHPSCLAPSRCLSQRGSQGPQGPSLAFVSGTYLHIPGGGGGAASRVGLRGTTGDRTRSVMILPCSWSLPCMRVMTPLPPPPSCRAMLCRADEDSVTIRHSQGLTDAPFALDREEHASIRRLGNPLAVQRHHRDTSPVRPSN